eukprot:398380_1
MSTSHFKRDKSPRLLESHIDTQHTEDASSQMYNKRSPSWIQSILDQREMVTWMMFWFFANLSITFYNKHVLSSLNASPLTNTFVHMTFTFAGCMIVQRGTFPSLTRQ